MRNKNNETVKLLWHRPAAAHIVISVSTMFKILRKIFKRSQAESSEDDIEGCTDGDAVNELVLCSETAKESSGEAAAKAQEKTPQKTKYVHRLIKEIRSRSPPMEEPDNLMLVFDSEDENDEKLAELLWKDIFQPVSVFELLQKDKKSEPSQKQRSVNVYIPGLTV